MSRTSQKGKPGNSSPAASRLVYSKPPLRSFTRVMGPPRQDPLGRSGHTPGTFARGSAADYSGASSVASALHLRGGRDSPADRFHPNTPYSSARLIPDISTLRRIGHFYFALTRWLCRKRNLASSLATFWGHLGNCEDQILLQFGSPARPLHRQEMMAWARFPPHRFEAATSISSRREIIGL